MALTITHTKVSAIPDDADTSLIRPSDWNATHALAGVASVAQGGTGVGTLTGIVKGNGTGNMTAATAAEIVAAIGATPVANATSAANGLVAIGYLAGNGITTAAGTTLLGNNAGAGLTTANYNTMLGWNAGAATTGQSNILIGASCGDQATSLTGCVVIGVDALGAGATNAAVGTVAVGNNSLLSLTTGANNTMLGHQTGQTLVTGGQNTFIGYQAGVLATNSGNTFVGKGSGSAVTSGANNTFIGTYTGTATMANSIAMSDGAGTIRQFFNNNGAMCFSNLFDYGVAGEVLKTGGSSALPYWESLRQRAGIQRSLAGINAAVVGVLGAALYDPVWRSAIHSGADLVFAMAAYALLVFARVSPVLLVLVQCLPDLLQKLVVHQSRSKL